ncbi:hypothetical protein DICSQDRAFT_138197 [Dichomitus squalens LYAD-421 SS1]|uniref:DUF7918 domain-containing protein n=1 Tax=Dichomitus squalens (strain LYAD-421) TaxID=732165 RepID=R7SXN6_DICSQ|nr:uncharacterized protein DICSQDRAFT_138197 [Dichomitus squalens LYAD-421 SS1]EJF59737.1 hypothetical protein DICSQDRAFT_138197 [Dichomitus squalens LYAD-421 SS1]
MLLNGYEAWVTCEGEKLPEYGIAPEGGDGKTVGCFMPSERGKTFAIQFRNGGNDCISLAFKVDGHKLGHGALCSALQTGSKNGVRTGLNVEQPFHFADLKTTDDDDLLSGLAKQADVGSIEVKVKRVFAEGRPVAAVVDSFKSVEAVHERSKKAGAHSVGLGGNLVVQPFTQMWMHDAIDPCEGFVATFVFRYKPRDLLEAQGIAPRDKPIKPEAGPSRVKQEKKRAGSPDRRNAKRARVQPRSGAGAKLDLGVVEISDGEEDEEIVLARVNVPCASLKQR